MGVLQIPPGGGTPGPHSITGSQIALDTVTGGSGVGQGNIAGGTIQGYNIASQTITSGNLAINLLPNRNLLSNPEFRFAQLYAPGSEIAPGTFNPPDNSVGFDCWKTISGDAGPTAMSVTRFPNNGTLFHTGQYFGGFVQGAVAGGKFMVFQGLESALSYALQTLPLTFGIDVIATTAQNIWLGILAYNGTADQLTNPVSAWNTDTHNPTLAAGWSYLTTFKVFAPAGFSTWDVSLNAVPNPVSTPFTNLAVAIWTDVANPHNQGLNISSARLNTGNFYRQYEPLTYPEDLQRVQRFIEKSYAIDTVPGAATAVGQVVTGPLVSSVIYPPVALQRKVKVPTVTLYSPNTGASGNWYDVTGTADTAATAPGVNGQVNDNGFTANSALAFGNVAAGHFVANASL
jgi:hypothetical protein